MTSCSYCAQIKHVVYLNFLEILEFMNVKTKQWLWFIFLWFLGLACAGIISYAIKLLIKGLG